MSAALRFPDPAAAPALPLLERGRRRADRLFAALLLLHLPVALALAPLHRSWGAALVTGGGASALVALLALRAPGRLATRIAVGFALMAYSALFIHQTGGMIEMHFHVFVSIVVSWNIRTTLPGDRRTV